MAIDGYVRKNSFIYLGYQPGFAGLNIKPKKKLQFPFKDYILNRKNKTFM